MSSPLQLAATPDVARFGEYLRHLRLRAGLNQRDLALAVGYSESQISRLEHGRRLPDIAALRALFIPALQLEDQPQLASRLLVLAETARVETEPPIETVESLPPLPTNALPVPLTALINRTRELREVRERIERDGVRLLTLIGPPGIGKTRLSLQIAADVSRHFPDGVFFVSLAPIREAELVVSAIARAVGLHDHSLPTLLAELRERQMLLVLDNFEQVVDAGAHIAALLRAAPRVKALVTSRAALGLTGEHLYILPPLELPDCRRLPPLAELARFPAIELFITRASAINPTFVLSDENAHVVAEICTRLDGLPLAIELTAARSRFFSPHTILERLRNSTKGSPTLAFLVGGPRDLPQHQQTLRGAIDWSYDLLHDDERNVFARLSVFAGSWTLEAACAVCECDASDIEASLFALVNQSLIQQVSGRGGELRFSMLEMIREYALENLAAGGQVERVREQHARYFTELAAHAAPHLQGAIQDTWLDRLEADYNNIYVALGWHAEHDHGAGLQCAADLTTFWHARGYLDEGRAWLKALLDRTKGSGTSQQLVAQATCGAGFLAYQQGDLAQAVALSEQSLALYQALGDSRGVALAMRNLGSAAFHQADYAHAAEIYSECLAIFQALGDDSGAAHSLRTLAGIAKDQGDYARARALHQEALTCYRRVGDRRGVAYALVNLSIVDYWDGNYVQSRTLAVESLAELRAVDDWIGAAYALDQIGMTSYKQGDLVGAAAALEESRQAFERLGEQLGMAMVLTDMGLVACAAGDCAKAESLHRAALAIARKLGDQRRMAFCLEGLAMALSRRQPNLAARLLGVASALRERIGSPLPTAEHAEYDGMLQVLKVILGTEMFTLELEAGRYRGLEAIMAQETS